MMILRTGIDLVKISRLKDLSDEIKPRFLKRVFTTYEMNQAGDSDERLSARFAAKEAAAKALGCGIGPVSWQEIEVHSDEMGAPYLVFSGAAKKKAEELSLETWSVSITHTGDYAAAVVVGIGEMKSEVKEG